MRSLAWLDTVAMEVAPIVEAHRAAMELRYGFPVKVLDVVLTEVAEPGREVYEIEMTFGRDEEKSCDGEDQNHRVVQGQEQ